jgi:hypothetical protein
MNSALSTEVLYTYSSAGAPMTHDMVRHQLDEGSDLSGTLDGYLLPPVVQFFCSARETGRMVIHQADGRREELFFRNGQIVDARCGNIKGRDAAQMILRRRQGSFQFRRGLAENHPHTIQQETMTLLLEVHHMEDEANASRYGIGL